jgi:hypothetical protein
MLAQHSRDTEAERRTVELSPRQGLMVPRGIVHRTRAEERTVVLMVEAATVVPTGDGGRARLPVMRRRFPTLVAAFLVLACRATTPASTEPGPVASGAPSASSSSPSTTASATASSSPAPKASGSASVASVGPADEPKRFEVKEGVAVDIGNSATLVLKDVMEAHLAGSKNESIARLVLKRGGQSVEVALDRLYPGPPKWKKQLGVLLAIDFVDAYHQPATGAILVRFE